MFATNIHGTWAEWASVFFAGLAFFGVIYDLILTKHELKRVKSREYHVAQRKASQIRILSHGTGAIKFRSSSTGHFVGLSVRNRETDARQASLESLTEYESPSDLVIISTDNIWSGDKPLQGTLYIEDEHGFKWLKDFCLQNTGRGIAVTRDSDAVEDNPAIAKNRLFKRSSPGIST